MTLTEMGKVLAVLLAAFPAFRPKVSEKQMRGAYRAILGDLSVDLLMQAAVHYAGRATFFPSTGELRRAYWSLVEVGQGIPSAQDAWAEVTKQLSGRAFRTDDPSNGAFKFEGVWYQHRLPVADDWSHPLVQQAIDGVGGWRALRDSEYQIADRARFIQAYEAYLERGRTDQRMLPGVRQAVEQIEAGMTGRLVEEATHGEVDS